MTRRSRPRRTTVTERAAGCVVVSCQRFPSSTWGGIEPCCRRSVPTTIPLPRGGKPRSAWYAEKAKESCPSWPTTQAFWTPLCPPTGTCLRTKKAQLPILLVQPTAANGALQKKWTVLGCEWDVSALDQFQSWCGTKATDPRPSNGVVAEAVQSVAVQLAANWAIVVTEAPKVLVVVLHEGHGADAPTVMGTAFVTGHPRTTIVLTNLFQTMSSRLFLGGDAILPHILEQRHNIEREHARLVCKANQDGLAARALVLEMLKDKPDTALITALTMALADQQEQTAHGSGVRTRWQQQKKDR